MPKMMIDIPKEISKKLAKEKVDRNAKNKKEVVVRILEEWYAKKKE